ncbi:uncharacterized protein J8A68_004015 [[Candida] subhashii]|uniref:Succinate dehydrogenase assembly factor 3 n=1 Tax=[Candida] subhashii TaxID=561895 RepID=A0A8J5QI90_9ASCO|nr:uncharacterized protein J8A68_004015 [[Candida] subhashii]KAG7662484.1 hypothetical protein J8A68_004015 [[Candida] subhashii]
MRPSIVRLVRARRPERKTSPLLPPLVLYRHILRAHKKFLSPELRYLGDPYVRDEFRAHQKIDNPLHIVAFLTEWQDYLMKLDRGEWKEGSLTKEDLSKMSEEQVNQLYELMQATKKARQLDAEEEQEQQ